MTSCCAVFVSTWSSRVTSLASCRALYGTDQFSTAALCLLQTSRNVCFFCQMNLVYGSDVEFKAACQSRWWVNPEAWHDNILSVPN